MGASVAVEGGHRVAGQLGRLADDQLGLELEQRPAGFVRQLQCGQATATGGLELAEADGEPCPKDLADDRSRGYSGVAEAGSGGVGMHDGLIQPGVGEQDERLEELHHGDPYAVLLTVEALLGLAQAVERLLAVAAALGGQRLVGERLGRFVAHAQLGEGGERLLGQVSGVMHEVELEEDLRQVEVA